LSTNTDPIRELKIRADLRKRELARQNPPAVVPHRECLSLVATELGFSNWGHAGAVLSGDPEVTDFGTLLYPKRCGGHLNHWYRRYEDALVGLDRAGGYLLAYRRDFFVADRPFIETLGLDPDAPEWRRIGFDWVRPKDVSARRSLYGALLASVPRIYG
jgi:hypothetical protein